MISPGWGGLCMAPVAVDFDRPGFLRSPLRGCRSSPGKSVSLSVTRYVAGVNRKPPSRSGAEGARVVDALVEITRLLTAKNAENRWLFAGNGRIISAGGAESVHPRA
jgi:hypothetical protein